MNTLTRLLGGLTIAISPRSERGAVVGTGLVILILAIIGAFAVLAFLIPGD